MTQTKKGWIQINEKVKVKVSSSKLYRYTGDKGWVLMPLRKKHK